MNEVNDSSESRSTSSNQADPNARDPTGRGRRWIVRVLLVVLILAAIWLYRRVGPAVEPWLRRFG
ncbi:MAG TPA: hypothetical protein VK116_02975, partial [Planctomycetota bacterium]|nr:hypothetical protein [Planctomycetota bacterium]